MCVCNTYWNSCSTLKTVSYAEGCTRVSLTLNSSSLYEETTLTKNHYTCCAFYFVPGIRRDLAVEGGGISA